MANNNPFNLAFGQEDDLESTYQPPTTAAWNTQPSTAPIGEDDDLPFTSQDLTGVPTSTPSPPAAAFVPTTASVPPVNTVPAIPPVSNNSRSALLLPGGPTSSSSSAPPLPLPAPSSSAAAGGPAGDDPKSYPIYSIKRYRTYFNVDTSEVLKRMFAAVILFFKGDFLESINDNPDLYGPFWVASTLVFVSAATGNYAAYLAHNSSSSSKGKSGGHDNDDDDDSQGWYYDIDKVGGSMALFYGYVGIVGLLLWASLRWFKANVSLAQVWCTYGYSMCIFIPMAVVSVVPIEIVRWSVLGAATFASGMFLLLTFRKPVMESQAGAKASPILLAIMGLHGALGLALKFYFFNY